jgi:hypothetical protein
MSDLEEKETVAKRIRREAARAKAEGVVNIFGGSKFQGHA